ncbi:Cytosine deaminase [Lachnellula subtilissima]|uniref:Cytosine deaminase n=1 Tax=Lachnellula subtilissima TaxID=602034 RepID=A0A8H8RN69_9HELO|nr:Cytosine deaminase [Lachnellula subtilissima]
MNDQEGFAIAVEEAKIGYKEGGVPIGAALVSKDGKLLGRGHNMRVQKGSAIHHGETAALENSGRLPASTYKGATMYTTLSPCDMWFVITAQPLSIHSLSHAHAYNTIQRTVPALVSYTASHGSRFLGGEAYLKQRGVEVVVLENAECRELMERFIKEKPEVWNEDIGEEERVHSKEEK